MRDRRVGAEMPGQIERQLHARRKFREALVDAELEIERAVLMAQHDRGGDRRLAGAQRHDLALAGCRRAPTVARRIKAASPSSCASAVPRLAFQPLASSVRNISIAAATSSGVRATSKCDGAVLGEAVALAAQFFQFLRRPARRAAIHRRRASRRGRRGHAIAARAARMPSRRSTSVNAFMAAPSSDMSRRISAWAPACRACCSICATASSGMVAIEQRRAKRAIGIGADQSGQGNLVGAPHRNHRHRPINPASIAPRAERGSADAAARGSVHRQFPVRADNSRSARRRARQARAIGSAEMSASGVSAARWRLRRRSARVHPWSMHDGPPLVQQSRPLPRFPVRDFDKRRCRRRLLPSRSRGDASERNGKCRWGARQFER